MKLLQELLKLREDVGDSKHFKQLDIWLGQGSKSDLESADVDVFYEYEASSYTDHPYGSTTAREHHGAVISITGVVLTQDAKQYDEDGDKVIGELKKGTDLMEQPWWQETWTTWLEDKIAEKMSNDDGGRYDDFDDRDDRDY